MQGGSISGTQPLASGATGICCKVAIVIMTPPPQCHCASVPLHGGDIMPVAQSYKRVFQLLSAGLFLPGSIGIPDPCEVGVAGLTFAAKCSQ